MPLEKRRRAVGFQGGDRDMRTRARFLFMAVIISVAAVACGRASQKDINSALHITPTATLSAAQIVTSTAAAVEKEATRTAAIAALSSPGAENNSNASLAAAGDVAAGQTQFLNRCQSCHRPAGNGRGPALTGAKAKPITLTDEQIRDLIRTGKGHSTPPGPYSTVDISDRNVINIIAYIRDGNP
jgi:mono/diheme cytochrome c family protein